MAAIAITVIGSVNLDIVARAARLPVPGETVTGAELLSVAAIDRKHVAQVAVLGFLERNELDGHFRLLCALHLRTTALG